MVHTWGAAALLAALVALHSAKAAEPAVVEVKNAIHVLGLPDVEHNVKGTLRIGSDGVLFRTERMAEARIPAGAIAEVTLGHETRALASGNAGKLLLLAPFGSGKIVSMIRPGIDTLTVEFKDGRGARHGCILELPKGSGTALEQALQPAAGAANLPDPPTTELLPGSQPVPRQAFQPTQLIGSGMLVQKLIVHDADLPPEFRVAIYEQIVEALTATRQFLPVSRAGDSEAYAHPNLFILCTTIESFKKGSERKRTLVPFTGATVIQARVQVLNPSGAVLLDRRLTGSVRTNGENLNAAGSLTKAIARMLSAGRG